MKIRTILRVLVCITFLSLSLKAQVKQVTLKGTVIDEGTKQPIPAVSLVNSTTNKAVTFTDGKGHFSAAAPVGSTLIFRYVGYQPYRLKVSTDQLNLTIRLKETNASMDEVVIRGFVARSKEVTTGSSFSVKGDELQDIPVANVEQLLQGKVPGLNIQNNTGAPGFRGTVQLRGLATLAVSNSSNETFLQPTSPLYVIDGIPIDADKASEMGFDLQGPGISPLSLIPQEDVESIEVLRDAQATALYGSRAAYGVIIITTKRGHSQIPRIRYTNNFFVSTPPALRETLGGNDERALKLEQIYGNAKSFADIIRISQTPMLSDSLNSYYNNSTNWQAIFYRKTFNQTHNLAIDGGDQKFNYKANMGYFANKGILKNTGFSRYTLNMNAELRPNDRFRFTTFLSGGIGKQQKGDGLGFLQRGVADNAQSSSLLPGPSFYQSSGGVVKSLETVNDNATRNIRTSIDAEYTLLPGLKIMSTFNYSFSSDIEDTFTPAAANQQFSKVYGFNGRSNSLYNRNMLNYSATFKEKHSIYVSVANDINESRGQTSAIRQERTPNDQFQGPLGFDAFLSKGGGVLTYNRGRLASFWGSASYDFMRKYILDLAYRIDGTSSSGLNNPFSKNPSVGLRWNFGKENWMSHFDWLNSGSIRVSWGKNITPTGSLSSIYGKYNIGGNYNNQQSIGIDFGSIPNPNLQPKTREMYNLGLDFSLFNGKADLNFDTYFSEIKNELYTQNMSNTIGFGNFPSNETGMVNYGYELYFAIRPLSSKNPFKLNLSFNGAWNNNILTRLPEGYNGQNILFAGADGQHTILRVGRNTLSNYLYINQGVYAVDNDVPVDPVTGFRYQTGNQVYKAGDPNIKDVNGDYILDKNDYQITGNSQPLITGGMSASLSYKSVGMNIYGSYTAKRTILNNALASRLSIMNDPFGGKAVISLPDVDMWRKPGDVAKYPYAYDYNRYSIIQPFRYDQTLWQEDGTYLKINNVTVFYTFPKKFAQRLGISNLRVQMSASNIITFSKYSGPNPENVTALGRDLSAGYPNSRDYIFGFNLDL
ncbi:SusC/RagA family TonB-linked outer membrane protein [Pedobacter nyackensis]|uniref:TonB-linked outer membrane protein, SusC/RagA family n=1 Tax=Pedobacter nyackensis TaxID=475255 RepID=A0A1W2CRK0_9SPHI|nr:SusC/RagA family TonB-linked outer membrane protein [Pedobacter nyackensis]SMC87278.1 TonB-linked outer membrane protein, SusC/RagA family [Pedobacter nyackensis]